MKSINYTTIKQSQLFGGPSDTLVTAVSDIMSDYHTSTLFPSSNKSTPSWDKLIEDINAFNIKLDEFIAKFDNGFLTMNEMFREAGLRSEYEHVEGLSELYIAMLVLCESYNKCKDGK